MNWDTFWLHGVLELWSRNLVLGFRPELSVKRSATLFILSIGYRSEDLSGFMGSRKKKERPIPTPVGHS
jgi:hypothetical protein